VPRVDASGASTQSGTESVGVSAGDQFGFVFDCTDCTDCVEGAAEVTISGFRGPGQVTSVPVNAPLALTGLIIVMAGLGLVTLRLRA
jgi:uncharacterized protein YaiE (UPF0345 family)